MAKKRTDSSERRARMEQLQREQARKERRRGLVILGVSIALVAGLLALALVPYLKYRRQQSRLAGAALSSVGATAAAARCSTPKTRTAEGSGQHEAPGTEIDYPDAPPAFGPHWGNFLQGTEIRNFYTTADRPPVERLVHSLEHGHTILWYDATVKPGTDAYDQVKAIAGKFSTDAYFMAAPWEKADGADFPVGKHVVLTHWTGPDQQKGVWEYCGSPSGEVTKKFTDAYQPLDAPEPGAA